MDRYTKADVANILANANAAGVRLGMRGAGGWTVQSLGGTYLYLTQADRQRIKDLGRGWHSAGVALIDFVQDLHIVGILRKEADDVPAGEFGRYGDDKEDCLHVNTDTQRDGTVLCNLCGARL